MNFQLMRRALTGENEATRKYCGSYVLVENDKDHRLYRCKLGAIPSGYTKVERVYDEMGYLFPRYWALPRIMEENKMTVKTERVKLVARILKEEFPSLDPIAIVIVAYRIVEELIEESEK